MKRMATICVVALCLAPRLAGAQQISVSPVLHAIAAEEAASTAPAHPAVNQTPAPAPAFVYSDGYHTRLKIHKIASVAMIPLVATEGVLGKMLYDNPTSSRRSVK